VSGRSPQRSIHRRCRRYARSSTQRRGKEESNAKPTAHRRRQVCAAHTDGRVAHSRKHSQPITVMTASELRGVSPACAARRVRCGVSMRGQVEVQGTEGSMRVNECADERSSVCGPCGCQSTTVQRAWHACASERERNSVRECVCMRAYV
jgi:hypothetical protein